MLSHASGLILFDKPQGWTSHDAAEAFRRMLPRGTKVGHCGSLDPVATGLLVLLVGPCTRMQARMQGLDKVYSGKIRLGVATDSGDITGAVTKEQAVPELSLSQLSKHLQAHLGEFSMPAPAYSAVKHQGKALYKYARKGLPIPVKPRTSRIYSWEAISYSGTDLDHRLSCSSGTYVRSLAESLGARLGCGATVLTLRRESIAGLSVADALNLESVKALSSSRLKALLDESLASLESIARAMAHAPA